MSQTTIPVLLITGYLGSGKTTLLNHLLANSRGIRYAVLVNDLGEVNIDATLIAREGIVQQADSSLVPLQNGCICCTLKVDLAQQIVQLAAQQRFDYIVIEASGICEPIPIAQTLCSLPRVVDIPSTVPLPVLDSIVTVVDALRLRDEFAAGAMLTAATRGEEDIANLLIQQIEFCNIVLINKASMVDEETLRHVCAVVRALQPTAQIVPCDYCSVPVDTLVGTGQFDFDKVATSPAWIKALEEEGDEEALHDEEEGEADEYGVSTFVYCRRQPMDISLFDEVLARHWQKGILRAKGLCYFASERHICYLFEHAGRQFELKNCGQWYATMPPADLEKLLAANPQLRADWDEKYGDRQQKIVFIGQNIDKEALTRALDACLVE